MRLHILAAETNRAGDAVGMADFGDAGDQAAGRTLQELDLQAAARYRLIAATHTIRGCASPVTCSRAV